MSVDSRTCVVAALHFPMLYLAKEKRYGRSDTGFELSSSAPHRNRTRAAKIRLGPGVRGVDGRGARHRRLARTALACSRCVRGGTASDDAPEHVYRPHAARWSSGELNGAGCVEERQGCVRRWRDGERGGRRLERW